MEKNHDHLKSSNSPSIIATLEQCSHRGQKLFCRCVKSNKRLTRPTNVDTINCTLGSNWSMSRLKATFQLLSKVIKISRRLLERRRLTSLIQIAKVRGVRLSIKKPSCSSKRHFQEVVERCCGQSYRRCCCRRICFHEDNQLKDETPLARWF